mgnify:CR=1 FL=1
MPNKKTKSKINVYEAPIGCWNCDIIYNIPIPKGLNTPEYLMNVEMPCKKCGCDTLKMLSEYKIEKKIMKDVILHHRIEHMEQSQHQEHANHDHYK